MLRNNLPSILSFVALIALLSPAAWTQESDDGGDDWVSRSDRAKTDALLNAHDYSTYRKI